jgi:hypothetical protein
LPPPPPSIFPEIVLPAPKTNSSTLLPPVRFSTPKKLKLPTVPPLAAVIDQTFVALGPMSLSAAEVLPTNFWMLAKPPVLVAVAVARLTVAATPPSP